MFCPHCGKENEAEARFCGHCGQSLGEPEAPQTLARTRSAEPVRIIDPSPPTDLVPPGLKWGVLAASLFVPPVGIGMGLYFWIRAESEDKVAVGKMWFFVAVAVVLLYSVLSEV